MSLADDKFLPTGTYAIVNAEYNHSIVFSEQDQCLSTSSADEYGVRCCTLRLLKRHVDRLIV